MHANGGNDQVAFVSAPGESLYKPRQPQSRNVAQREIRPAARASAANSKLAEAQDYVTSRGGAAETQLGPES
jgi:hypothetical protein